jgi:hypothetical protein
MAIFSVSVKAHSRSKGESATGGAAYRLGLDLTNELTGERHNYSNRKDVACAFTLLPENAPEGWSDPAKLWNEAEKAEKRINSCVSREVLVALPSEMTNEQREELARSIASELVERYGVGISCGIHEPDKGELNYHAHILMTTRRLGPDGLGEKTRELDDKKQGPEQVAAIREMVANRTNEHLQRHGYEARVDHRSLEDQRQSALDNGELEKAAELSRAPTHHRGRNPEVSARVEVENENTKQANIRSQAEARAIFASMEQAAKDEGRLMAPASDTPKSKQEMEAEAKEERQKKERAEAWALVVQARETERERLAEVNDLREKWQVAKMEKERAEASEEAYAATYSFQKLKVKANKLAVSEWEEKHPWKAKFNWKPEHVTKSETQAEQGLEDAKAAKKELEKAAKEKKLAEEKTTLTHALVAKHVLEAEKDRVRRNEAEARHDLVIRMHKRENLTPAQVKQEALERAREAEWVPMQVPDPKRHLRHDHEEQQQLKQQQNAHKGPQMKPTGWDYGQSM